MEPGDFRKKIEPYITIGVIFCLIFLSIELAKYNNLQEEINENCGWEKEDYYCYCEYSDVVKFRNIMEDNFNLENVEIPR